MGTARWKTWLVGATSVAALGGAGWGVREAMRSPMFTLEVVELANLPDNAPVDEQAITQLAALPVGKVNLFDLDLKPVEERILSHPWIREVRLEKHFPQTLSISVTLREPQAFVQSESGALSYVDVDGRVFGQVNLAVQPDLPIIASSGTGHIPQALALIHEWDETELSKSAQLSLLQWDAERGFRALVSYPLGGAEGAARGRTFIDLGQDFDAPGVKAQIERLSQVFGYLTANRVVTRQIWADAGKKIVVKTARGS
jgi:hypothetical protein